MDNRNKKKGTVLLVDDEPNILAALRRLIWRDAEVVMCATRAEEALTLLTSHRIDVLISDARMPGMDGLELMAAALQMQPDCYRILMSGHVPEDKQKAMIQEGLIQAYVGKPWRNDLFCNLVRSAFQLAMKTPHAPG